MNATAPMRGRCFIGTYVSKPDRIGSYWLLWTGKHYGKQVRGGTPRPSAPQVTAAQDRPIDFESVQQRDDIERQCRGLADDWTPS